MSNTDTRFLIDTNVFVTSSAQYYGFSFCPGFWDLLKYAGSNSVAGSIDRIKEELTARDDEEGRETDPLSVWIRDELDPSFFRSTIDDDDVAHMQANIMRAMRKKPQYKSIALSAFARGVDSWLMAYAHVHNMTVVTLEVSAPLSLSNIKIPDVCKEFDIPCVNTFEMLEKLQHQLVLKRKSP